MSKMAALYPAETMSRRRSMQRCGFKGVLESEHLKEEHVDAAAGENWWTDMYARMAREKREKRRI